MLQGESRLLEPKAPENLCRLVARAILARVTRRFHGALDDHHDLERVPALTVRTVEFTRRDRIERRRGVDLVLDDQRTEQHQIGVRRMNGHVEVLHGDDVARVRVFQFVVDHSDRRTRQLSDDVVP